MLKQTAAVFHCKQNYQNPTSTECAENLISYLNMTRCCKCITVDDLHNIIHGIAGQTDAIETVVDKESYTQEGQTDTKYMLQQHVIAGCLEGHIA